MGPITVISVTIVLFAHPHFGQCHLYNEEGWTVAGAYMKEAIDQTADQCNDFYRYACGKWVDQYNGTYRNEVDKAIDHATEFLIKAIRSIRTDDPKTPTYQKRLSTFFMQCINDTEDENEVFNEIYEQIDGLIGPMPLVSGMYKNETNNIYTIIGLTQQNFNTTIFIKAAVEKENVGCGIKPILTLYPAKPKDSHRIEVNSNLTEWLLKKASEQKQDKKRFFRRLETMANLEKEMTTLIENSNVSTEIYRVDKLESTFYTLNSSSSQGTLLDYFKGLLPSDAYKIWLSPSSTQTSKSKTSQKPTRVVFQHASYFHQLDDFIKKYDTDILVDYMYWRAMIKYKEYFLETPQYYDLKNLTNATNERHCVDYVLHYASAAAARLFFEAHGSDVFNWKYDVELIVQAVLSAFRYTIYNTDWLDPDDKVIIMNKLKKISVDAGVPDWILDDVAVEEHTPPCEPNRTTFENDFMMFRQKFIWNMQPLWKYQMEEGMQGKKKDVLVDPEPKFIPNAIYTKDNVEVWLGALLPPQYNYSYPLALKFGAIGAIVGEQLMRAFDPDEMTELMGIRDLLKPVSITRYRMQMICFARAEPGLRACLGRTDEKCKGFKEDLHEWMANTEGMKLAYMAYAFLAQTVGREPSLPGLLDYDADQLFFLSFARLLCGYQDGVEVPISHFPAFAKAFKCKQDDRFAQNFPCSLWSNVSETFIARRLEE